MNYGSCFASRLRGETYYYSDSSEACRERKRGERVTPITKSLLGDEKEEKNCRKKNKKALKTHLFMKANNVINVIT
ncbi:hypothetical protein E2C01_009416 [Portunus trituberculatus]|uniref:Uncharacterized protein n=1 Tax=Portunus trituberculatus TaxID=210409 RepID=A0A5B7D3H2_PORTR|nr:hypothetical protein [Portunus trituberculatus]